MPVPDYQQFMLPVLRLHADGAEHNTPDAMTAAIEAFRLSPEDIREKLPSGQARLVNRVAWARIYLTRAGLLESVKRGVYRITERGRSVLAERPTTINNQYLKRFPEFLAFSKKQNQRDEEEEQAPEAAKKTPREQLEDSFRFMQENLAQDLLSRVRDCTPAFFEQLVIDLLVAMGYGGSRSDAAQVVGGTGDGGIDGTIKQDKLGLDVVYVQAKRWVDTVSRPRIQEFAGALAGKRAHKGVFITTSRFSRDASEYANAIATKIVLIDGAQLAELMIEHNIGVASEAAYVLKRIDSDYFTEE
jgi:restriction system protein